MSGVFRIYGFTVLQRCASHHLRPVRLSLGKSRCNKHIKCPPQYLHTSVSCFSYQPKHLTFKHPEISKSWTGKHRVKGEMLTTVIWSVIKASHIHWNFIFYFTLKLIINHHLIIGWDHRMCRQGHSPHWTTSRRWSTAGWRWFRWGRGEGNLSVGVWCCPRPHKCGTFGNHSSIKMYPWLKITSRQWNAVVSTSLSA